MSQQILAISIVFVSFSCSWLGAKEAFSPKEVDKLVIQVTQTLEKELVQRTQRREAKLQVLSKTQDQQLHLFLAKRSQRDTIFNITITRKEEKYEVRGKTFTRSEKNALQLILKAHFHPSPISFSLDFGSLGYAIVTKPLADLYVAPKEEAGGNLASQLMYGTPLWLLETDPSRKFLRVQSQQDGYLGWILQQDIVFVTTNTWHKWTSSPVFYLKKPLQNFLPGTRLLVEANLPQGWQLRDVAGKEYFIPTEASPAPTEELASQVIQTAKEFLPQGKMATKKYLWGGTAPKQLDCSGFVQLAFRLNHILLPRDADQQFQVNSPVKRHNLQPGDLVFFSSHGKHPTHVGIYLGEERFIHCSPSGKYSGVKINSLAGEGEYEQYLNKIYYAGARVAPLK